MKVRPLVILGVAGTGAAAAAALLRRDHDYSATMHPDDWRVLEGGNVHRRYGSLGQAFHHLREAACLTVPTAEVYLRQAISPAFREQIMITTAVSNKCPI